jgi:hypothetical protein
MDLVPLPALLLAGVLLGLACATPVSAVARLRRGEPLGRAALSTGLLALVALQLVAGLLLLDATWPLTGYPMYAVPIAASTPVDILHLVGTTESGQEIPIPGTAMFADPLDLQARLTPLLRDPSTQNDVAARLMAYYNAREPDPSRRLVGLRAVVEWRVLQPDGAVVSREEPLFAYGPTGS